MFYLAYRVKSESYISFTAIRVKGNLDNFSVANRVKSHLDVSSIANRVKSQLGASGGQISTKHLKTSIRPFFAYPNTLSFGGVSKQAHFFWGRTGNDR
jgi:hypothetical protein